MKGFAGAFASQPERFIYKDYHVTGPRMQIFAGVAGLPWALKPIVGLLSDLCPIGGYNKMPYIVLSSITGVVAILALGFLPQNAISVEWTVGLFFLVAMQRSVCDLLTEP